MSVNKLPQNQSKLSIKDLDLDIQPEFKNDADNAPDGGYGWFVVFASFSSMFTMYGTTYSYGVFLSQYKILYEGRAEPSTLALLGTICSSITFAASLIAGRLAEKLGYRLSILSGGFLFALGLLLASFSTEVWQLFLTQGVMMGLGGSAIFIPIISAPSQWFTKRRGLAQGIAMTGSGVGGLTLPLIIQTCINHLGLSTTLKLLSLFSLITFTLSSFLIRTRVTPTATNLINWKMFLDLRFRTFFAGEVFFALGFLAPIILLHTYTMSQSFTGSEAALVLGLLNGASAVGRLVLGFLADHIGALNTLIISSLITSLSTFLIWPFAHSLPIIILYGIVFGFFSGGFVSLVPLTLSKLFGVANLASTNGMVYFGSAIPVLIGTPIITLIVDASSRNSQTKNYIPAMLYIGSVIIAATLCFIYLRCKINPRALAKL